MPTLVARLRAAGAIPIARTNLPDLLFAFESDNLICGRTNNPYDFSRTSGGSSGGEAALIAACGSPFGLGSDAAGSVRLPAHFCGIASLKPTSGRLPRTGHVPPAGRVDRNAMADRPDGAAGGGSARHDAAAGYPDGVDHTVVAMPYGDSATTNIGDLRVAFFTNNGIVPPEADTAAVVRQAADALANEVRTMDERRPPGVEESYELEMRLIGPDGGDGLRAYLTSIGSTPHSSPTGWVVGEARTLSHDCARFRRILGGPRSVPRGDARVPQRLRRDPLAGVRARGLAAWRLDRGTTFQGFSYTMTHNLTGWPAAVVRCGQTAAGLPIGVQIAAHPWREEVALRIAERLEDLRGGWQPSPLL